MEDETIRKPTRDGKSVSHWDFKNFYRREEEKDEGLTDKHLVTIIEGLSGEKKGRKKKVKSSKSEILEWKTHRGNNQRTGVLGDTITLSDMRLAWCSTMDYKLSPQSLAVGFDGLYAVVGNKLARFDIKTGKRQWMTRKDIKGGSQRSIETLVRSRISITGTDKGIIHLIGHRSGAMLKKIDLGTQLSTHITVENRQIVYGTFGQRITIADIIKDTEKQIHIEGIPYGSPLIAQDNIYINTQGGKVYSIGLKNHTRNWTYDVEEGIISPMATDNDNECLYIATLNGSLICMDAQRGKIVWKRMGLGPMNLPAIVTGDKVCVANEHDTFYCLNKDDGTDEKAIEIRAPHKMNPAAAAENRIYYASSDILAEIIIGKNLYEGHKIRISNKTTMSSPIMYKNMLFVAAGSGTVDQIYAFEKK